MKSRIHHKVKTKVKQHPRMYALLLSLVILAMIAIFVSWWLLVMSKRPVLMKLNQTHARIVQDEPLKPNNQTTPPPVAVTPQLPPHDATIPPVVNGVAPVISSLETKDPVVFLTIDDGAIKLPSEIQMVKDKHVKASLFLADLFIKDNPDFFKGFLPLGSLIEDHSITHSDFAEMSYGAQKQEICGQADLEQKEYGRRPVLFRPPGGNYNINTPIAAAACGMKAVVLWKAKANGGSMQYQIGHSLRPGDIVLMHFRPVFQQDLQAFLDAQNAAGLHTELLEDWLP